MADPLAEYTVRDFSAVDRQIEQIAERERVVTQKLRLANLFQILKFAVIGLIAAGVFFVLLGIAYRIAFPPEQKILKKTEVVHDKNVRAQPQTIVIQTPTGSVINPSNANSALVVDGAVAQDTTSSISNDSSRIPSKTVWGPNTSVESSVTETTKEETVSKNDTKAKLSDLSAIGKRSVTTFTTVDSNISGFGPVTTGWRWGDVDAKTPKSQYCYVNKYRERGISETIDIADKLGLNDAPSDRYSVSNARVAGLSKTQWQSILRKCSWF